MPSRSTIALGVILILGLAAALLAARAPVSTLPSSPLPTSTSTPTSAPTLTPSPTPTSTPTPTQTPTPTPVPTHISPPLVSPAGGLAYVEDRQLLILGADGRTTLVTEADVAHDTWSLLWSPDGRRLLYAMERDAQREYHIWDGTTGKTLHLNQEISDFRPDVEGFDGHAWSPDGTHLLFKAWPSLRPADSGVWALDLEDNHFWRVAQGIKVVTATWVNTGTILYQEHHRTETLHLVDVDAPMEPLTDTLDEVGADGFYALSPDYRHLAGISVHGEPDRRLRVAPLPGHSPLALTVQPTVSTPFESDPLWSPDGRWIAYGALEMASPEEKGAYTVLVDTTGLSPTRVTSGLLPQAWSPDGRLLAGPTCGDFDCGLAVADIASGQVVTLASGEQVHLWDLAWSRQGVYLAYSLTGPDADLEGLVLWDRVTGERRLLMPGDEAGPFTDLQWAPDGCYLLFVQRKNRPAGEPPHPGPVEAVWGVGPGWDQRWRVAPSSERTAGGLPLPCPSSPLEGRRLIAFYGTPLGPGLGILGRYDITTTLALLDEQAQVYRDLDPDVETLPAFHMISTVADGHPGGDGDYNHRIPHKLIRRWIDGIRAAGGWSMLDVQAGHADLDTELDLIEPFLGEPDVILAIDPEFMMHEQGRVPGIDLGHITGPQVNRVQARLERIGRASGLRKVLLIHQFDNRMIKQKGEILHYPFVDLVWDADGFGGPGPKIADYNQYRWETGFEYGGFKLFYNYDTPLMAPEQVLALKPPTSVVIYQ